MDKTLKVLAAEIDAAVESGNTSTLITLVDKCCDELEIATSRNRSIIYFFKANCYKALAITSSHDQGSEWSWRQNERILEILSLRRAISEQGFSELNPIFQCKILTNLGSCLNYLGRFVEAIKSWNTALEIIPNFAMALGNKGIGLSYYSQSLYDYSHAGILIAYAKEDFNNALSKDALWDSGTHPEAKDNFKQYYNGTVEHLKEIKYDFAFDLNQWPLGESEEDIDYRGWCLRHRLFLSPLNDVCKYTAAAQDVIHLPNHTYKISEKPRFPNYFNLLKQEYITARYMLFEALNGDNEHISDKDVLLLNGFDGVHFGYRSEQLKAAYRLVYSLFDKIALFLNDYFSVGLKAGSVSFRKVWGKTNKNKQFELHPCFEKSENWPLRGLYYLSKDLFDDAFVEVSLPEAQELASLRNRTEHRFLSLQDYATVVKSSDVHSYITISDFEDKTMRVITMAREALIYLSLAMHREEAIRDKDKDTDKLSVSIQSMPIKRA